MSKKCADEKKSTLESIIEKNKAQLGGAVKKSSKRGSGAKKGSKQKVGSKSKKGSKKGSKQVAKKGSKRHSKQKGGSKSKKSSKQGSKKMAKKGYKSKKGSIGGGTKGQRKYKDPATQAKYDKYKVFSAVRKDHPEFELAEITRDEWLAQEEDFLQNLIDEMNERLAENAEETTEDDDNAGDEPSESEDLDSDDE